MKILNSTRAAGLLLAWAVLWTQPANGICASTEPIVAGPQCVFESYTIINPTAHETSLMDEYGARGVCPLPSDPDFDSTCLECADVPNGGLCPGTARTSDTGVEGTWSENCTYEETILPCSIENTSLVDSGEPCGEGVPIIAMGLAVENVPTGSTLDLQITYSFEFEDDFLSFEVPDGVENFTVNFNLPSYGLVFEITASIGEGESACSVSVVESYPILDCIFDCNGDLDGDAHPGTPCTDDAGAEGVYSVDCVCEVETNTEPCTNFKTYYIDIPGGNNTVLYEVEMNGSEATLTALGPVPGSAHIGLSNEGIIYLVTNRGRLVQYDPVTETASPHIQITYAGVPLHSIPHVAVDPADGTLYVASTTTSCVYSVDVVTAEATLVQALDVTVRGGDLVVTQEGDLLLANRADSTFYNISAGGIPAFSLPLGAITGAALMEDGNILVSHSGSTAFAVVDPHTGTVLETTYESGITCGSGDLASACVALGGAGPVDSDYASVVRDYSPDEDTHISTVLSSQPNPTMGPSAVSFVPAHDLRYVLEVYDLNGRRVDVLFNQPADAGATYRVDFDGAGLPNGIYLYRLTSEREVLIDKFMIAK